MLLSLRKNGLTSLFKEVRVFKERLVVPGLTGPKSLCVRLETQEIQKPFPLVNRRVVPGLSRLSQRLCVQSLCAFRYNYKKNGLRNCFPKITVAVT